ncbi:MAG TPA: sigma-70 family RNA polymerase sigma factor [Polyangiaceae bacterium]|nr:sigma-70 family RNA polymerase sigma factor [Polyangiaceae bacterium]
MSKSHSAPDLEVPACFMMVGAGNERHTPPAVLEPRFYSRVELDVAVRITHAGGTVDGRSVNISEGGIAVLVSEGVRGLERISVAFELPTGGETIRADGRVVRVGAPRDGRCELAISFELSDVDAAAVRDLVVTRGGIAWEPVGSALPRELALRFIPFFRRAAFGLAKRLPPDTAVDDLVGAAFVALVELHRQHSGCTVEELEALAMPRLRYAMLDQLRDSDPLSRRMRRKAKEVGRTRSRLENTLGRPVTRGEIAAAAGQSEAAVAEAESLASSGSSASWSSVDDVDIPDPHGAGPEVLASRAQSLAQLRTALDALPPRHRKVLDLYYGEELTLRQIGNILGVTEARISQLVSDAVKKLRERVPGD